MKLLAQQSELYVLAESHTRIAKERSMRRRQLKRLWARLKQLEPHDAYARGSAHEAGRGKTESPQRLALWSASR